jgi:hypothetical protein
MVPDSAETLANPGAAQATPNIVNSSVGGWRLVVEQRHALKQRRLGGNRLDRLHRGSNSLNLLDQTSTTGNEMPLKVGGMAERRA